MAVCIRLPQSTYCTYCTYCTLKPRDESKMAVPRHETFQSSRHNIMHHKQNNFHITVQADRPAYQIYCLPPFYVWLFITLRINQLYVEVFTVRSMWKGETVNQGHITVNTVLPWVGSVRRYLTISSRHSYHLYLPIYVPYQTWRS
jgi:hypothetical protein